MDMPEPFGYKMHWWAIRSTDRAAIVEALHLTNVCETTWKDGLDAAYSHEYRNNHVFLTPSINGWTLIVHNVVYAGIREIEQGVVELSKRFDEVQAFETHRITESHSWVLAKRGELVRSFGYVGDGGEWFADFGEPTPVERAINWNVWNGRWVPDEANVMEIAGQWSIDPTTLGPETPCQGVPWLTEVPLEKARG